MTGKKQNTLLGNQISNLPQSPGIYKFLNQDGEIIYVGKSIGIKDRVKSYFASFKSLGPKTQKMVGEIAQVDYIETESEIEALILESDLIKRYKPEYNVQWKDDKGYKYIRIQNAKFRKKRGIRKTLEQEKWPWVTTSRKQEDPDSLYFGPFPEGKTVNQVLRTLRKIFPWCQYNSKPKFKKVKSKPCFYYHIKLCPGICVNQVKLREYWQIIDHLVLFLSGKKAKIRREVENKMKQSSRQKNFEAAAYYRDVLARMDYITQNFRDAHEYVQNPDLIQDQRQQELDELTDVLDWSSNYNWEDFRIEGYDISNLGREHTVGSRVVFIGGEPAKSQYRRYKIKTQDLPDDYAAMHEVLSRRFKNPPNSSKKHNLPNLILVDGGKGQLSVVLSVLKECQLQVPAIGLAKKIETLIVPQRNQFIEINLPKDSRSLKLLMRIRDESHRFAQNYHKLLRAKQLRK